MLALLSTLRLIHQLFVLKIPFFFALAVVISTLQCIYSTMCVAGRLLAGGHDQSSESLYRALATRCCSLLGS
jgi:hypothetical protein